MQKSNNPKSSTQLKSYIITGNSEISTGVHVISFRRDFKFEPGHVVKIAIDSMHPPRIYSICSGNTEPEVRILFNIKDEGFLTPKLSSMIPGEEILVSEPYGSFTASAGKAWWIATGTGIAPFNSMIKSGISTGITLIHGVRHINQFYFEDDVEEALGENYVRCCSQDSACNVFHGRVTDYLKQLPNFPHVKYYICGQALMVVEVRDLLIERGIRFENIIAEIYF